MMMSTQAGASQAWRVIVKLLLFVLSRSRRDQFPRAIIV